MIKKIYRLTGRDIDYLFRKKNIVYSKDLVFFIGQQKNNNNYNQFSFQVSLKLSKKACTRNHIKRLFFGFIEKKSLIKSKFSRDYLKIFVFLNKKSISNLKKHIETEDKNYINGYLNNLFKENFKVLLKKAGSGI